MHYKDLSFVTGQLTQSFLSNHIYLLEILRNLIQENTQNDDNENENKNKELKKD